MGIREIFKCKEVNAYLPHAARKFKIRTTFSYGPTLGKKILNYNKVLKELKTEDLSLVDCDCKTKYPKFVYPPHGHVHTGQLDIIENKDLRDTMAMGAKFRLTPSVGISKIWKALEDAILVLKKKLSKRTKLKVDCFISGTVFY